MIVVDVGCARYGGYYSIERLAEDFQATRMVGFDPAEEDRLRLVTCKGGQQAMVAIYSFAAWVHDGRVGFRVDGLRGHVEGGAPEVWCIDLARFIRELPDDEIVLKIDAEGAEYDLLPHLIDQDVDRRLKLALVEWHEPDRGRAAIEARIACELREWRW